MRHLLLVLLFVLLLPAQAAEPTPYDRVTLSEQASTELENDLNKAQMFAQAEGDDAIVLADRVNRAVAGTLAESCSCKGCRLIISYHDFHGTPGLDEIRSIIRRIAGFGPNVAKVVTTARLPEDVKTILATYCVSDLLPFDLVAFAMGEIGGMSRIACLALGAPFTYVALNRDEATAPGQLDLDTVRSIVSVAEPEEPLV